MKRYVIRQLGRTAWAETDDAQAAYQILREARERLGNSPPCVVRDNAQDRVLTDEEVEQLSDHA